MTPYYTTGDVAGMFNVARKTVAKWCSSGVYPGAIKTGSGSAKSEWRIPAGDVEAKRRRRAESQPVPRDRLDQLMDAALAKSA